MPTRQPEQPSTIRVVDENLQYGFAQIPRPVLRAKGLSLKAKMVYTLLLDYAWTNDFIFPGQQTMAVELDTSVDTVQRALQELRKVKLVDWKQEGLNKPNTYYLLRLSDSPYVDLTEAGNRYLRFQETAKTTLQETANSGTNNTKYKDKKKNDNNSNFRIANKERSRDSFHKVGSLNVGGASYADEGVERTNRKGKRQEQLEEKHIIAEKSSQNDLHRRRKEEPEHEQEKLGKGFEKAGNVLRRRRNSHTEYDEKRQIINAYIGDFARELSDQAPLKSSISRAYNLMTQSGISIDAFIAHLYEARAITKERSASIKSSRGKMAYFFSVLEERLGLKDRDEGRDFITPS